MQPYRFSADLSQLADSDMVIIKLGFFWHSLWGIWEFFRITKMIEESLEEAKDYGLLHTEFFLYSSKQAGLIQHWRSYEDLENWSNHNAKHSSWWKQSETKKLFWNHLSIYHEVYLVSKEKIETVYNLHPAQKDYPSLANHLPHLTPTKYKARDRFLKCPYSHDTN